MLTIKLWMVVFHLKLLEYPIEIWRSLSSSFKPWWKTHICLLYYIIMQILFAKRIDNKHFLSAFYPLVCWFGWRVKCWLSSVSNQHFYPQQISMLAPTTPGGIIIRETLKFLRNIVICIWRYNPGKKRWTVNILEIKRKYRNTGNLAKFKLHPPAEVIRPSVSLLLLLTYMYVSYFKADLPTHVMKESRKFSAKFNLKKLPLPCSSGPLQLGARANGPSGPWLRRHCVRKPYLL